QAALQDDHPGVRKHAVRICESFLEKAPAMGEQVLKLVNDPDIHVRMQVAYTLGEWKDAQAGKALGELALKDGHDPYFLAAVMSSVTKDNLEPMLLAVLMS